MKVFPWILLYVALTSLFAPALAVTSAGPVHPYDYYLVSLDNEGDALVQARLGINNLTDKEISSLSLEIPGQATVFTVIQEPGSSGTYPYPYGVQAGAIPYIPPEYKREALLADFNLTHLANSTQVLLALKKPIPAHDSASVFLLYKVSGLSERDFLGNWVFDFATIVDSKAVLVQGVRVAVNVQEDLFLKGGQTGVDYKAEPLVLASAPLAASSAISEKISSGSFYGYSNQLAYVQGQIVKTASNLDALESFHVQGTYSSNPGTLYAVEIFIGLIVLAGILIVLGRAGKTLFEPSNFNGAKKTGSGASKSNGASFPGLGRVLGLGFALGLVENLVWTAFFLAAGFLGRQYLFYSFNSFFFILGLGVLALVASLGIGVFVLYRAYGHGGWKHALAVGFSGLVFWIIIALIFMVLNAWLNPTPVLYGTRID